MVRRPGRQDVHTVFEFVNANQADLPVRTMCQVLEVSHSGFYDWLKRAPSQRAMHDAVLSERIRVVHADSHETYGMPRIRAELAEQGVRVGGKRIARLMRAAGLRGVSKRRGYTVTTQRDARQSPAPDLVNRSFKAGAANQWWVADMTYVPTWAGFVYLAVVVDVWSRRIVGWSIGERMAADRVLGALNRALAQRKLEAVIHHSDQGSQYTRIAFGRRGAERGVRPSMGSVGDAYDNAMAESFFATLECELLERRSFKSKSEARTALFTYIEGWYNPRRRHSGLGDLSPVNFERQHHRATQKTVPGKRGLPTVGVCVACATPPVENPASVLMEAPSPA